MFRAHFRPALTLAAAAAGLLLARTPAAAAPPSHPPAAQPAPQACEPAFPLSTRGRYIVDRCGNRFKLKSFNWAGASDRREVPGGLDHQSLHDLVSMLKRAGFNSVRLPFSNDMLHPSDAKPAARRCLDNLHVTCIDAGKNPNLVNLTALQVLDSTVAELTRQGMAVILNNHTTNSVWCCGWTDANGFWDSQQSLERWQNDWVMLARRYSGNPAVVGADLRNEVRPHGLDSPNWGQGNRHDWRKAAQEMGNRILDVNPNLLIVVEAVNWWGLLVDGSRPYLRPAANLPVLLKRGDKLVYAVHNYGYIGPNCALCTFGGRYADLDRASFNRTLNEEWGFALGSNQAVTAPVWVSEFGASYNESEDKMRNWLGQVVDYMADQDVDWAYWAANALKLDTGDGVGREETFGLFVYPAWDSLRVDWRSEPMRRLMNAGGKTGAVALNHFFPLYLASTAGSELNALDFDWHAGYRKVSCPGTERMTGISNRFAILCTNSAANPQLGAPTRYYDVVTAEANPLVYGDWARGSVKLECPLNAYAAGISYDALGGMVGLLCAGNPAGTGYATRTALDFWRNDNRKSTSGGDWRSGELKAQCRDDQYVIGVAHAMYGAVRYGAALLCAG